MTPACGLRTYVRYFSIGFNNPSWSWKELEATLSGRRGRDGRAPGSLSWNSGGDGPAWGRKRQPYEPPRGVHAGTGTVPYAELHCHSNFSFLDGASHPEELASEVTRVKAESRKRTISGIFAFPPASITDIDGD